MFFNTRIGHLAKRTVKYGLRRVGVAYSQIEKPQRFGGVSHTSPPTSALDWLRTHEISSGGIRVHSGHANAYPGVSGYLVPTLLQFGDRDLALRLVRWLIAIQRADGSFTGHGDGESYIFDTGQVLRGLLAAAEMVPLAKESARRAADYLCAKMCDQGRGGFGDRYAGSIPEGVHLYVLPPLIEASVVLGNSLYREAANNCLKYYISHSHALRIGDLTHFLAYQLEALIDLSRSDLALPVLEALQNAQQRDGAVRGVGGKSWVCIPGLAQLAICWYKTGHGYRRIKPCRGWNDTRLKVAAYEAVTGAAPHISQKLNSLGRPNSIWMRTASGFCRSWRAMLRYFQRRSPLKTGGFKRYCRRFDQVIALSKWAVGKADF